MKLYKCLRNSFMTSYNWKMKQKLEERSWQKIYMQNHIQYFEGLTSKSKIIINQNFIFRLE